MAATFSAEQFVKMRFDRTIEGGSVVVIDRWREVQVPGGLADSGRVVVGMRFAGEFFGRRLAC